MQTKANRLLADNVFAGFLLTSMLAVTIIGAENFPTSRDPLRWPFSQTSIWNMPIGSDAEYVPQPVDPAHIDGIMVDLDIIIMTPDAPLMPVYGTDQRWESGVTPTTRCTEHDNTVHLRLPIPDGYITSKDYGSRPNNPCAVLQPDGRTIVQAQPFQVCEGGYATNGVRYSDAGELLRAGDVDIYSEGLYGMHGGSGLSTLGGAIRVGELAPGSGPIRHALKIAFPGEHYLYYDHDKNIGYRWPARKHDSNASTAYRSSNPEARIGCLRAIPADISLDDLGLETEAGRKIAWTLQNYGAYQCEGVPWARCMIAVEDGPEGCVPDVFEQEWGYALVTKDKSGNPLFRDMIRVFAHLHIVKNNSPESIGGGGTPLQPLAPPLSDATPVARPGVTAPRENFAGAPGSGGRAYDLYGRIVRAVGPASGVYVTVSGQRQTRGFASCASLR